MLDEQVKKYEDGHGCFIAVSIADKDNIKVTMNAGGDNNATIQAVCAAFIDIAKKDNVRPVDLLPFITNRLVKETL